MRVKKFMTALLMVLVVFMFTSTVAFAADTTTPVGQDWITWEVLATFVGMTAAVALLTQVLKSLPFKLNDSIDPKWYTLGLSIVLNCGVQFIFKQDFTAQGIFMMVVNILVVFSAAVAAYESVVKPIQRSRENK